ncbi:MAG: glycosyltransferase family 39 protein [Endomicrobium sp.]|jgi:undecaprenyl-diphosphatase|nr:glycosyltransferase family 39 protein [Endomicrobium sp.]
MEKIFNKKTALFVSGFAVLFKVFLSASLELHPDEAYYWLWAQNLALGYYDHAPMAAYFIKLTTLFSDSEFFVRFSCVIVTVILSFLLWNFAKKLFNETVASASVIILNTLPIMFTASIIMTPDTPVFLFWSFAVYFLWRLCQTGFVKYWYLTGIFFGLALLSKYTAVLFAGCLLLYIVFDKKTQWFKNKHFYLMFAAAFAVFLPVIIWNYQNGWISFTYQLGHGLSSSRFHFNYIFEYLGGQCLIAGPFVFFAGFCAFFSFIKKRDFDSKNIFLFSFSVPVILFFACTAVKRLPGANWPSFAYFTFSVVTAAFLLCGSAAKKKILIISIAFNVFVSVLLGLHVKYAILPVDKFSKNAAIADATNWFAGWKKLADNLLQRDVKYAVTDRHQWGAAISYYSKNKIKVFIRGLRKNQFAYWPVAQDLQTSKTALVKIDNEMTADFTKIDGAEIIYVERYGFPVRQYAVSETQGYDLKGSAK